MTTAWTGAQDFQFIAVAPHVYYMQSTKVKKLPYGQTIFITSVIEHAVVIRLRLSETSRSGKMQTSLRILLVRS